ncbi:triose-phosphate isomerase [Kordiimonas pumila]|uniref:Triosephosphate isomerase n=1 Tax=Kordiimonas pumila TaxID=2161677 RepID=A0ABV7D2D6_9PROT|nr:triose-phosphate isomerase [Kordiimonas pumila]
MKSAKNIVAGNWKMNGLVASLEEIEALATLIDTSAAADCDVIVCPPYTLVCSLAAMKKQKILVGAQDCHVAVSGAHTGDISALMLKDAGASHIIVGHSERRADHGETSALVHAKATAIYIEGLKAIICIGETEAERDNNQTEEVVLGQLKESVPDDATPENTVIAYEPVWAIGTGKTPTVEDVAEIHTAIRKALINRFGDVGAGFSLLYGGSVKPSNAKELMTAKNVNGALVGGASLKASDFNGIIEAYRK